MEHVMKELGIPRAEAAESTRKEAVQFCLREMMKARSEDKPPELNLPQGLARVTKAQLMDDVKKRGID
eukprot:2643466-Alexandrium_andersonii.AAC.1